MNRNANIAGEARGGKRLLNREGERRNNAGKEFCNEKKRNRENELKIIISL